jgi:hypothetical protein
MAVSSRYTLGARKLLPSHRLQGAYPPVELLDPYVQGGHTLSTAVVEITLV